VSEATTDGSQVRKASFSARLVAIILAIVALALIGGGGYLLSLGGSPYYLLAGLACIAAALGLWRGRTSAGLVYAGFLVVTLIWAIFESGLVAWPLVARLAGPAVVGLLVALVATGRRGRQAALAASVLCIAVLTAAFLRPHPETVAGITAAATVPAPAQVAEADWLHWGYDQGGSRHSPASDITPANVATLKPAWTFHVGQIDFKGTMPTFEAVPLEADGLITFCTPINDVIALDAATGKERWRWKANVDMGGVVSTACRGVARHVDPAATGHCAKRIITATLDARMIALDALDGKPCEDFGQEGQIDLTQGYGDVWKGYYYVTSAPAIVRGKAVIGGWVKDGQFVGEPSGVIRAFDVKTGKLAWAWDMGKPERTGLPGPGEEYTRGTPNSWAPISADEQLGMVYLPMGNAGPDYSGQHRRDFDNKYSSATVALDAETGALRWVFQSTHLDVWDYDVASQPTMFDLQTPAGPVPALAQGTKRAQLFILDRRTGKPLKDVTERKVPTNGAPGEKIAPTQPFSTGMPDFSGPELTEAQMWGLTPLDQMICRIMFRKAEYAGPMTPIQLMKKTIVYPGYIGGMNWGSVTVDPARQMVMLPTNRFAMYNELLTRAEANRRGLQVVPAGKSHDLSKGQPMGGTPYGVDVTPFLSPLYMPCQQPPFAMVQGVDLKTGKAVWQKPFGDTRNSGPLGMSLGLGLPMGVPFTGGAISTASGLTFIAASQDGQIRAYETATGREMWKTALPFSAQTTPMTYKLKGGKQYVVVVAGGSALSPKGMGDAVVAYALPD
jgi:quinoprotein glucose dehydrogenase